MQVLKRLIYLLALLPMMMLNSCAEDDVNEIFVSGQWALINYYNNIDWGGKLNNHILLHLIQTEPLQVRSVTGPSPENGKQTQKDGLFPSAA